MTAQISDLAAVTYAEQETEERRERGIGLRPIGTIVPAARGMIVPYGTESRASDERKIRVGTCGECGRRIAAPTGECGTGDPSPTGNRGRPMTAPTGDGRRDRRPGWYAD